MIDLALRELRNPYLGSYRKTMILGAFRENVYYTPGIGLVSLNPSISHFYRPHIPGGIFPLIWPGPRFMANWHFKKAVAEHHAGRVASAFVQLGRVSHLLTDMACPVHAQSVFHSTDPFEWCVEAMKSESLEVADVPKGRRPSELIQGLADYTQSFVAEKTNNPWGALMEQFGMRTKLKTDLVRKQAQELIPKAAGYTIRLFQMFLEEIEIPARWNASMAETLHALQMPPQILPKWFAQVTRFCHKHGGRNYYGEILELMEECRSELQNLHDS